MKAHVYSRIETVVYVVAVIEGEPRHPFAEALDPTSVRTLRHYSEGKPFSSMRDKKVKYVERIGCGTSSNSVAQIYEKAKRRAAQLNLEFAEL